MARKIPLPREKLFSSRPRLNNSNTGPRKYSDFTACGRASHIFRNYTRWGIQKTFATVIRPSQHSVNEVFTVTQSYPLLAMTPSPHHGFSTTLIFFAKFAQPCRDTYKRYCVC